MNHKRRRRLRRKRRRCDLLRRTKQRIDAGMLVRAPWFGLYTLPALGHVDLGVTFYRNTP